ncbi:MAG: hypothetical protein B6I31_01055 [Desulfobacteraceae bacterium 4572_19]|nr:MAG: hypothetical protein B6I31_01055 [Desulfobacteraceae bacterium 4572_19]
MKITGFSMKKRDNILSLCVTICFVIFLNSYDVWATTEAVVEEVILNTSPSSIRIKLNIEAPYKVIQVDDREILIAFKDAWIGETIEYLGDQNSIINRVNGEMLAGDVAAFVINTKADIKSVKTNWIDSVQTLSVVIDGSVRNKSPEKKTRVVIEEPKVAVEAKKSVPAVNNRPKVKGRFEKPSPIMPNRISQNRISQKLSPTLHTVEPVKMGEFSGTTADILVKMTEDRCSSSRIFKKALELSKKEKWQKAFSMLDDYIVEKPSAQCLELSYFLRAYNYYRWSVKQNNGVDLLKGTDLLQQAITLFPESPYLPYAFASLGQLYLAMKNQPQAVGYFSFVLDSYKKYPGKPELLYEIGRIYADNEKLKDAIVKLDEVIKYYPESSVFQNSRIKYGEVLFKQKQFIKALKVLSDVVQKDPQKIYEKPDLLLCMGNAYYELGDHKEARKTLLKVYNLFPDLKKNDIILTKIGDSYAGGRHTDKAIAIYRLVTKQYPDTEGFIISSMRLADIYEDRAEKEKLYNMIIKDYPKNPLAHMSMMRMAGLQFDEGEFKKAITTVEKLLTMQPGALKYDALVLMSKSYMALYDRYFKDDDYPAVLTNYEVHKRRLDLFENKKILLLVGKSYLKAHLFEQAFDRLMITYKLYEQGEKRPPDLIYNLAMAMYELNRHDEALNMFKHYVRKFPKGPDVANAYFYMGKVRLAVNQYEKAIKNFKLAFKRSNDKKQKADILMDEADGYIGMREYKKAVQELINSIDLLASEPEKYKKGIFKAYKNMGDAYLAYNAYVKAAQAFSTAVGYADPVETAANMQFLTGDAYEKGDILEKAVAAFNEVVSTGDSFWGAIARERLRSIELSEKLSKT